MAASPDMRASDGDRDKVATVLQEHYAQGRLSADEFNERLEQLYGSKTYGELAMLTSDLPDVDLRQLRESSSRRERRPERRDRRQLQKKGLAAVWASWAAASGVNWAVWLILGVTNGFDFPYPWPLWVMGPWGVMLLITTFFALLANRDNQ
ncbi:DUF1707 domain-containing protein [Streptosporangium sp. NPDC000396]|uniref:DUF1707 SHOCT-like domain-containing protein n=1 Tax=Streptosporangium sp. NPDC000396 TaxID=3366185 RepID=UPI00367B0B2E